MKSYVHLGVYIIIRVERQSGTPSSLRTDRAIQLIHVHFISEHVNIDAIISK
jgi:ribosomal protein L31E